MARYRGLVQAWTFKDLFSGGPQWESGCWYCSMNRTTDCKISQSLGNCTWSALSLDHVSQLIEVQGEIQMRWGNVVSGTSEAK